MIEFQPLGAITRDRISIGITYQPKTNKIFPTEVSPMQGSSVAANWQVTLLNVRRQQKEERNIAKETV